MAVLGHYKKLFFFCWSWPIQFLITLMPIKRQKQIIPGHEKNFFHLLLVPPSFFSVFIFSFLFQFSIFHIFLLSFLFFLLFCFGFNLASRMENSVDDVTEDLRFLISFFFLPTFHIFISLLCSWLAFFCFAFFCFASSFSFIISYNLSSWSLSLLLFVNQSLTNWHWTMSQRIDFLSNCHFLLSSLLPTF